MHVPCKKRANIIGRGTCRSLSAATESDFLFLHSHSVTPGSEFDNIGFAFNDNVISMLGLNFSAANVNPQSE